MPAKRSAKRKRGPNTPKVSIPLERVLIYLIALFVFSLPLFIWPGVSEYGYGKSIFALIGISILLIIWGVVSLQKGHWPIRLPWVVFPALGLVLASLLSLIHAVNGCVVVQSLILFIFFCLFTLLIVNVVKDKRDVTLILYALLLSAFLASLYGLLQYLGVMRGAHAGTGLSEIISTMGNRNYLGGFLAYLLFPSLILLVRIRRLWLRVLALVLLGFVLAMLLFVQQTGVRVALLGSTLFLLLGVGRWAALSPLRRAWTWWVAAGGICLAALATVLGPAKLGVFLLLFGILGTGFYGLGWALRRWRWVWAPTLALGLLALFLFAPPTTPFATIEQTWERNAGRVRSWDWWVGWEMLKDHPIVGVGLGNYKLNFLPYKAKFLATPQGSAYDFYIARAAQAHNEYIQFAAELGVLGILSLLGLLIILPWSLWRRLRLNSLEEDRFDLLLLGCGMVAFLIHALVSFPAHLPASSLLFILIFGLAASEAYGSAAEIRIRLKGWLLKALFCAVAVLGLAVSIIAARDFSANRLMQKGYRQLQMGQEYLAVMTLERSLQCDFCPRQIYLYLSKAKVKLGLYEEALEDAERCLTRFVDENVYLFVVNLAINLEKPELARENVDLLLATLPSLNTQKEAEYLSALVTLQEGDPYRAISELEMLVERYPNFGKLYAALGRLYSMLRLYDPSRENYERALQLIDSELARTERKIASLASAASAGRPVAFEDYTKLLDLKRSLQEERKTVEAGLAELPSP
jgi:O-antigen ligase